MNATIIAVLGYIGLLVFWLVFLGAYRTSLVLNKSMAPNKFKSDGSNVPALGQRLTRVQANAVESFPFTCGVMILALATNSSNITDGLALWLLAARCGQALTHILSTSVLAVQIRFAFFIAQVGISVYWLVMLGTKFI
ncbi:MAPEG family protein [Paraglaciecola sp.]|uniref:MAPEG family protein n=1 Tax=Paraglaciecola sp. TaxID=1920173 RepID=UPI003EF632F0